MSKFLRLREGWSTTLLLVAMIVACGSIFARANWTSGLEIVLWTGLGGMLVGLLLGWSVFFLPFGKISNFGQLWENLVRGCLRISNELLQGDYLATTLITIPLVIIYLVRVIVWMR